MHSCQLPTKPASVCLLSVTSVPWHTNVAFRQWHAYRSVQRHPPWYFVGGCLGAALLLVAPYGFFPTHMGRILHQENNCLSRVVHIIGIGDYTSTASRAILCDTCLTDGYRGFVQDNRKLVPYHWYKDLILWVLGHICSANTCEPGIWASPTVHYPRRNPSSRFQAQGKQHVRFDKSRDSEWHGLTLRKTTTFRFLNHTPSPKLTWAAAYVY